MLASSFDVPLRLVQNRARGYRRHAEKGRVRHEPYGDISYNDAGGGMLSTAIDQVRLGLAVHHGLLIDPETLENIYDPLVNPSEDVSSRRHLARALVRPMAHLARERGPRRKTLRQPRWLGAGVPHGVVNFPEQDQAVAVMINIASNPMQAAMALASKVLAHEELRARWLHLDRDHSERVWPWVTCDVV